jgi:hypothetical protein
MTASALLSKALVITRSLIPGAKSAVRTGFIDVNSALARQVASDARLDVLD